MLVAIWIAAGFALLATAGPVAAQPVEAKALRQDKFRQLDELLPTPNEQRTAAGAPGPDYWQQRADYVIDVAIEEKNHKLTGQGAITYHNRSPHSLQYLWLQLDQNYFAADADSRLIAPAPDFTELKYARLDALLEAESYQGEAHITAVTDHNGAPMAHTIVKTVMRIDLPQPLVAGGSIRFSISWHYQLNSRKARNGRTGYEISDGNALYSVAQWYPRMAAYTDATGWQIKQYLGQGEFATEFGNFEVRITVPADHVVAATGVLKNADRVLTPAQRTRLKQAEAAASPVLIVTPEEARRAERNRSSARKTWIYAAENVRDFAFASSRRFIWDAMGVPNPEATPSAGRATEPVAASNRVLAMSFYPKEAGPLWGQYATRTIAHTLNVYSRFTFPYPYPVAIAVNSPIANMEYPMLCFVSPRTQGQSYSKAEQLALISMLIHEVGHNYLPMIVNTDERQWSWMDEGLTSFLQNLAEREWEPGYAEKSWVTEPVTKLMTRAGQFPIMTAADSVPAGQTMFLAYAKPATALSALRETVLGRESFDHAFKSFAQRWMFKRPYPADFFRSMEDASGVDLDWFWRSWFYGTEHVDLAIGTVHLYQLDTSDPQIEKRIRELRAADSQGTDRNFYVVELKNPGGLPMPVLLRIGYADETSEVRRIPAEIWQRGDARVAKLLMTKKTIKTLDIDHQDGTFDADRSNNSWNGWVIHEPLRLN